MRTCCECKIEKSEHLFYRNSRTVLQYQCIECNSRRNADHYARNGERLKTAAKRYKANLRQSVLDAYGGKCNCCGEDAQVFLALDHVNGGGSKEAGTNGSAGIYRRARDEGFPTDQFQLLCHNCNWAKHHTGGNCPHIQPSWMPAPWGGGPL